MLPPVSTRTLLTAIEKKRREDAALRWRESFQVDHRSADRAAHDTASRRSRRD
jgi:hypothetical protein